MNGIVTNIQRFSIHDGPGIRTTVFFKGRLRSPSLFLGLLARLEETKLVLEYSVLGFPLPPLEVSFRPCRQTEVPREIVDELVRLNRLDQRLEALFEGLFEERLKAVMAVERQLSKL